MGWRRKPRHTGVMLALAGVSMLAGCVTTPPATTGEAQWRQGRFEWSGAIGDADVFAIVNRYGDVRVRTTKRGQVRITAQSQTLGAERFEIDVDADHGPAGVSVSASHARPRGRIDLVVLLPPGKSVQVTTTDDLAEVKYPGNVHAATTGGRTHRRRTNFTFEKARRNPNSYKCKGAHPEGGVHI